MFEMHSSFSRVSRARAAQSLSVRLSPLALACAFICLPAQAQTQTPTPPSTALPEVPVTGQAERIGQQLAQPARSASHTGVSNQEVPASVDGVSAEQMQERGDYALVDAVTRTVGLTSSSTPGNGGLAFSSRGFAGEVGHTVLQLDGPRCSCGRRGCAEALIATRAMLGGGEDSTALRSLAEVRARLADQEPETLAAVASAGHYLGVLLQNLATPYDPGCIVVGGAVVALGDAFLKPALQTLND